MKVSFKLDMAQLARARARVLDAEKKWAKIENKGRKDYYIDAGNLGGPDLGGYYLNPNKKLKLEGQIMTYEGDRKNFIEGGFYDIARCILTGERYIITTLEYDVVAYDVELLDFFVYDDIIYVQDPLEYKLSPGDDARLYWYENLETYMRTRASVEEVIDYLKPRDGDVDMILTECRSVKEDKDLMTAIKAVGNLIHYQLGSEKTLRAAFDPITLSRAKLIAENTPESYWWDQ